MDKDFNNEIRAIGRAIARERERQGISQTQLALMLGYTNHAHLSRIENGKSAPSLQALFAITNALGIDIHSLIP